MKRIAQHQLRSLQRGSIYRNVVMTRDYFNKILLRDEVKAAEKRSALTPNDAKHLLDKGYEVTVESSAVRIFQDKEYKEVGCKIVDNHLWLREPEALKDTFILGLKELPEPGTPLTTQEGKSLSVPYEIQGTHIYFAHCYKEQTGWEEVMDRFDKGKGELIDLEFLVDDQGKRIAAFGYSAGFAGMATGLLVWSQQQLKGINNALNLQPYPSKQELVEDVQSRLKRVKEETGKIPTVQIVGVKGRCGTGSKDFATSAGIENIIGWDMEETAKRPQEGYFSSLMHDADILVNDMFAPGSWNEEPYLSLEHIKNTPNRRLTTFVDVSCDIAAPHPVFAFGHQLTTFEKPSKNFADNFEIVSIDNLPTLTPRESSIDFSSNLVKYLEALREVDYTLPTDAPQKHNNEKTRVFIRARQLFKKIDTDAKESL